MKKLKIFAPGLGKVIHGYTKEYFIEALYNSKKIYFLKIEHYYSDNKKLYRTGYYRCNPNKTLMDIHEVIDVIVNENLITVNVWYDLY